MRYDRATITNTQTFLEGSHGFAGPLHEMPDSLQETWLAWGHRITTAFQNGDIDGTPPKALNKAEIARIRLLPRERILRAVSEVA